MRDSSICNRLLCYQTCLDTVGAPEEVAKIAVSGNCLPDRILDRIKEAVIFSTPTPNTGNGRWTEITGHRKAVILYSDGFSEEIDLK